MSKPVDKYNGQRILVFPDPSKFVKERNGWVVREFGHYFQALSLEPNFILRKDAENDPDFRQPIPYAVIRCKKTHRYLSYKRKGKEGRLADRTSIGVGGHIDFEDLLALKAKGINHVTYFDLFAEALKRELQEELPGIEQAFPTPLLRGFIMKTQEQIDSTVPVDNVHFGVVVRLDVEEEFEAASEEVVGEWLSVEDLYQRYDSLESWSKSVADNTIFPKGS